MKRTVAVFTGSRAEYGLLFWLLTELRSSNDLSLRLLVGGMHLAPEFGETWRQIEADGFTIDARIDMLLSSDRAVGVAKSIGIGTMGCAEALDRIKPDVLVVLGDRFEALSAVQAALILGITVAHLHGGEITEGAYDDAIRHAITKMSQLHFVAAESYRRRVIQMGEHPDRVFQVGALGLDHILRTSCLPVEKLSEDIGFALHQPYFVVTYHPVTMRDGDAVQDIDTLLTALDSFPEYQILLTYPNADNGGRAIIERIKLYALRQAQRVFCTPSLGFRRYLSAVAKAAAVIGNSSSGIIEVPSFRVPTVNIGTRQQGRLAAESVLHCGPNRTEIEACIRTALSTEHGRICASCPNPYGQGDAARRIAEVLRTVPLTQEKHFYDLHNEK